MELDLNAVRQAAKEQGVTDGELRQIFREKGYSEEQISEYVPFDYDSFYQNARQQKKTNNQMREMLKQEGMSDEYIDSKIKYDIAEARDNFVSNYGLSDSEVKQILADKGYSNAEIANMYDYGGYAQKLISKGYTQDDVKNFATRMINDMNMNYSKAKKLLNNFFGLGFKDIQTMLNSLYGAYTPLPNLVKQYKEQGMSQSEALAKAREEYRNYRERGIKDREAGMFQETYNLVGYPIAEGLGRLYQAGRTALSDIGVVDRTIEDEIMADYYTWRTQDNPIVEVASKAPLAVASFASMGLAQVAATGFGISYMESRMEGKSIADSFKDASVEAGLALGLVGAIKGMPYVWEGIKSLKQPKEAFKSIFELPGIILSPLTEKVFVKNIIDTYKGDKQLAKKMLDELNLLENKESLMLAHLQQNPETNTFVQRLTDLQGRGVLGSVKTTTRAKEAESAVIKAFDKQKEQLFGKSQWAEAVEGVNKFQEKVRGVVNKAHDIRKAEHDKLYDIAREVGNKVELNSSDAKKLKNLTNSLDKFITESQSSQSEKFLGSTAKNLLSQYKLGDDLVIDSLKSFYSSQINRGQFVVDTKNIKYFENTIKNLFKDKFSKEELKDAVIQSKKYLKSIESSNADIMKQVNKIESQLRKKEQLKRPTARSKEIIQELSASKDKALSKFVDKTEIDYMRKELKYIIKNIGELDRFKRTPKIDDLKVSLQRFREFDPSLPFVQMIQRQADEGIKKVIFGKETFKKGELPSYEKFTESLSEANTKYKARKDLYDDAQNSPGLYKLHKTSSDYVNTLVKALDNPDTGLATTRKLSKEIDLAYKGKPKERKELKAAISGYIVDYKTQEALHKLSSSNDTALTVKGLISDLDSVPTGIFKELEVKEAPRVLNLLKKTLNRVKILNEKVAPTRFGLQENSFNPFDLIVKFITSSTFGYVLRSPKTTRKAIKLLEEMVYADDANKMLELARKYKDLSNDSNKWYSAILRSQMLYNDQNSEQEN